MRFYRDRASSAKSSPEVEVVEVATLEDLVQMMEEFDERLILYPPHETRDVPLIRIFDDYVE